MLYDGHAPPGSTGATSEWKWNISGAPDAWPQLVDAWNNRPDSYEDSTFDHFAFQMLGQQSESRGCDSIGSKACGGDFSDVCGRSNPGSDAAPPAAAVILTSLSAINQVFSSPKYALDYARTLMEGTLQTVAAKFSPPEDDSTEQAAEILGLLAGALPFASASALSSGLGKLWKIAADKQSIAAFREVAAKGVDLTAKVLDAAKPTQDPSEMHDNLESVLGAMYRKLADAQTISLRDLMAMNGSDPDIQHVMGGLLSTGALLNTWRTNANFTDELVTQHMQMMYGQLIQSTWALSTQDLRPFILRVDKNQRRCGDEFPPLDSLGIHLAPDAASKALWCDPSGYSWYLLNGYHKTPSGPVRSHSTDDHHTFEMLPGRSIDVLTGESDAWAGLQLKDIIVSAYTGFEQNGNRNGYNATVTSSLVANDDMTTTSAEDGLPMQGGVRSPGFFRITICLDYNEAIDSLSDPADRPICGISPVTIPTTGGEGTAAPNLGLGAVLAGIPAL
ncbi:hypothetical protein K402DRAFT_460615 [Aulographum hederae CBS 113979]|uniref:Uncharacterized protein n=1 Tax=Aulographum hederae CBS 113979 TaxID=1176131 RepID=A0A6G1HA18_9PEZI|nr:hypothetical protein K402DRAFT_460615 [Aulographum hederae CBS 113979]